MVRAQPVQFSHEHHVNGLGLDCRFCHSTVETAAFAGMPPTETCYGCHKLIWADSPELLPVRESARTGAPIAWSRVYDLPDFVYFNHSIHLAKGVGCGSCHGDVARMQLLHQSVSLHMEWCLSCHRDPGPSLRPGDALFDTAPRAPDPVAGASLAAHYQVRDAFTLTNCSTCHR
ncbi:MAG: cytochrome c3 family protein [Polyangiaceae bacterium]